MCVYMFYDICTSHKQCYEMTKMRCYEEGQLEMRTEKINFFIDTMDHDDQKRTRQRKEEGQQEILGQRRRQRRIIC